MIKLVQAILKDIGVTRVLTARDGQAALEIVERGVGDIGLVVCDWMMPRMDGLTFLTKFRELQPDVPFVMLTAKQDTASFHAVKRMSGTHFFMKPLDPGDLRARLKSILNLG